MTRQPKQKLRERLTSIAGRGRRIVVGTAHKVADEIKAAGQVVDIVEGVFSIGAELGSKFYRVCVERFVNHSPDRMNVVGSELVVDARTYVAVNANGWKMSLVLRNERLIPRRKTN